MTKLVYLAGPITGLTYEGCTDWREYAKEKLDDLSHGQIKGLSPMRWKGDLRGRGSVILDCYEDTLLSSQRGITERDHFDTRRSDMILANFLGAKEKSTGTILEIGWASAYKNPIMLCMEKEGNVHDHAMIRELCPFRVDNLDLAIETIVRVLMP